MSAPTRYSTTAISLHWLIALLICAAFAMGLYMTGIPGITPQKLKLFSWHKWIGVTIFGFVVLRVLWRASHPVPALPVSMSRWQQQAAHAGHGLLYVLMIIVPLTGYFYSAAAGIPVVYLGWFEMPMLIAKNKELQDILGPIHAWLNYFMAAVVVLHVLAALKHHWVDKDGTLAKMLPFLK